ncbi:MAG: TetR/AcrR family transcriptional regulator [Bacteroidales bacterium]|nr:TetR/AcrR family transcriptional regulator [Bacteroidales bacterium]
MKLSRDYLIEHVFELYLQYGYSGVSVSVIQEKLGIGRASMYYYFKDMDDMFKAVVNRYFFDLTRKSLDLPDDITLKQMIETRINVLSAMKQPLKDFENKNINMSNLASLILVSISLFPECMETARELKELSIIQWSKAIRNSVKTGEIRSDVDVDVMAMLFSNIKDAHESFAHLMPKDSETYSEQAYMCIYNLIKQ